MDDLEAIRERLNSAATSKKEREALNHLLDTAWAGLASGMTQGVKAELESILESLWLDLEQKAEAVKRRIKE